MVSPGRLHHVVRWGSGARLVAGRRKRPCGGVGQGYWDALVPRTHPVVLPDGSGVIMSGLGPGASSEDLLFVPLNGEKRLETLFQARGVERNPAIAPNGRFIAYNSDESGRSVGLRPAIPRCRGAKVDSLYRCRRTSCMDPRGNASSYIGTAAEPWPYDAKQRQRPGRFFETGAALHQRTCRHRRRSRVGCHSGRGALPASSSIKAAWQGLGHRPN